VFLAGGRLISIGVAEENDEALAKLPQPSVEFQKRRRFSRALIAGKPVWSFLVKNFRCHPN
jgi:hypothetical protein